MIRKNLQHISIPSEIELTKHKTSKFQFSEGIAIKSTYAKEDIEDLKHLNFAAGIAPNLRGSCSTMYIKKPWIIRNNIIDLSKKEHTINSIEDVKNIFKKKPLDKIPVSINTNDSILAIMAFYIVSAEELGFKLEQLSGIFTRDISQVFSKKYKSKLYLKIISDIFEYTNKHIPNFKTLNISNHQENNNKVGTCEELANSLTYGLEFLKTGLKANIDIDTLAPHLSFSWNIGTNYFMEIAKMRAARMLWAKLIKQLNPKNNKSLILRVHYATSNSPLTNERTNNNICKKTVEATAAIFGGTESLNTNTFKEKTESTTKLAKNIHLFLQEETKITKTVDPWAGSYFIEKLTHDITQKTWSLIKTIKNHEDLEKSSLVEIIKSKLDSKVIQIENHSEKLQSTLSKLTHAIQTGQGNLLALTIEAARERATLTDINNIINANI